VISAISAPEIAVSVVRRFEARSRVVMVFLLRGCRLRSSAADE
jgi:hypothetical protein